MAEGNGDDDKPDTVKAMNPGSTTIDSGAAVLIAQDNEENWVIIWVEC